MSGLPPKQGLYDPFYEKDACGVGFVVDIQGRKSHKIVQQGFRHWTISAIAAPAAAKKTPVTAPAS
jgi:hypothetical protein